MKPTPLDHASNARRQRRRDASIAALVFFAALAARFLFLAGSPDRTWPHSLWYEGDAPLWIDYAAALESDRPFELGLPVHAPGTVRLLAWLGAGRQGCSFLVLKVVWCAISAAGCALAYLCFVRTVGPRCAAPAALLGAWSFGGYITATSLNNETPYTAALMAIVLLTLRITRRPSVVCGVGLGTAHGVAWLLRAEHVLAVIALAAYTRWHWRRATASSISSARRDSGSTPTESGPNRRRSQLGTTFAAVAACLLVCAPWTVHAVRSTLRYNDTPDAGPDYASAAVPWTADGRAFIESLPPFCRGQNYAYLSHVAGQAGDREVTAERARELLLQEFGYVPEPLSPFVPISSQGPLSFALANHPDADGGFSKAALDDRFEPNPRLNLAIPSHLLLYNHGYAAGASHMRSDVGRWLRLVGRKLRIFAEGLTLGWTSYNLPFGRAGVRRPVDLVTPSAGASSAIMQCGILALFALGVGVAWRRRCGGVWLCVIGYKVIVTIAFYGYARQAVSILPAFHAFVAVGVVWLADRLTLRRRLRPAHAAGAAAAVAIVIVALDVATAVRRSAVQVQGPRDAAPRWGVGAFESHQTLTVTP